MRGHLYSLHPSIWNVVEVVKELPDNDNEDFQQVKVEQMIHHNTQAIVHLLSSLNQEEYDKVDGLKSAK